MRIEVKVIASAKKNCIKRDAGRYKVYVSAPAVEGKANKALIEALAGFFGVPKSSVEIIKGLQSRNKIINIQGLQ